VRADITDKGTAVRNPIRGMFDGGCALAASDAARKLRAKLVRRAVPPCFMGHLQMAGMLRRGRDDVNL
jgi:hypothetical protein